MVIKINTYVKNRKARIFENTFKRTKNSPDMSGILQLEDILYFVALWKTVSRKNGKEFFRGLMHVDGERGRNVGSLNLHLNNFYVEGGDKRIPYFFGKLTMGTITYKAQFWKNKTKNTGKAYYGGVLKDYVQVS